MGSPNVDNTASKQWHRPKHARRVVRVVAPHKNHATDKLSHNRAESIVTREKSDRRETLLGETAFARQLQYYPLALQVRQVVVIGEHFIAAFAGHQFALA